VSLKTQATRRGARKGTGPQDNYVIRSLHLFETPLIPRALHACTHVASSAATSESSRECTRGRARALKGGRGAVGKKRSRTKPEKPSSAEDSAWVAVVIVCADCGSGARGRGAVAVAAAALVWWVEGRLRGGVGAGWRRMRGGGRGGVEELSQGKSQGVKNRALARRHH
jgi:hypothetical protein